MTTGGQCEVHCVNYVFAVPRHITYTMNDDSTSRTLYILPILLLLLCSQFYIILSPINYKNTDY